MTRVSRGMAADTIAEDFVTIVPVGEGRPTTKDPSFVTVLMVGAATGASEVIVRRSRGERLGLGLKFEGGSAAAEKVRKLLVQSCAEESPAANAQAPWGKLIPGDEILAIDGVSVSDLTRIDCVRRLKDSDESLTLLVRHCEMEEDTLDNGFDETDSTINSRSCADIVRPTTLPPPVPPRKLGKKNSFKDKAALQSAGEPNLNDVLLSNEKETITNGKHNGISTVTKLSRKSSFDSHIHRQSKEGISYFRKGSPEEVRRLVRRLSDGKVVPPEAEIYIDLLSTEWERCLVFADAESDDTGSSISTVVDRLGSISNSVENSIPSTPTMQPKTIDIQKVLNCIENIDTNILKDITRKPFMEKPVYVNNESKVLSKPSSMNSFNVSESTAFSKMYTEENIASKRVFQNDKNNNNTVFGSVNCGFDPLVTNSLKKTKMDQNLPEKPKPMPRNAKIERSASEKKPRTIPIPEVAPPPVPDTLLTPTKKNCIETWLQRSEAEMNSTVNKLDENTLQEILPRLIDFVPKPQYNKDSNNETSTLTRPTTAPPPPPTETREDGSGASLDTIGELDETVDVTDTTKSMIANETKTRKSTFERSFWDERISKSDAEDKSLSNDDTPLPSCPRQPPDGVETPSEAVENSNNGEKVPDLPSRLPPRLPAGWPVARSRFSYSSRTQDARSEASVKDKIAMFSNDHAISTDRIDKCGTLPSRHISTSRKSTVSYMRSYSEVSSLDRRLTKSQDNLDEVPRTYKRQTDRPDVPGAVEDVNDAASIGLKLSSQIIKTKPLFYGSTTTLPSSIDNSLAPVVYHTRSVSDDNTKKTNMSSHRSNLDYLIEQRKKSMSKLRGLVIPEAQGPIVDLPEIKVQDRISNTYLLKSDHSKIMDSSSIKTMNLKTIPLNDLKWKVNLLPNNIPKYSPAFKRKSLQVYTPSSLSKESTPERILSETYSKPSSYLNVSHTLKKPIETNNTARQTVTKSPYNSKTMSNAYNLTQRDKNDILNYTRDYKNMDIKLCTATDVVDSDNDSAMSSTQSSYRSSASSPMHNTENVESDSSRLSPRISHYSTFSLVKTEMSKKPKDGDKNCNEYIKRNVCRSASSDTNVSLSSSAGSAATSGSQASCSSLESSVADSDRRKVSNTYDIDTINRRNILASAKCRNGRDAKLKSPVVETKFSHESCNRPPSPVLKTSERLSTLTSVVSAISNKGENRRRNKVVAETDSDSDNDANIRQRKIEYKNTRLKRNSSASNKNKTNDINSFSSKIEDVPKDISEKVIKEIKKASLVNYNNIKLVSTNKVNNDLIKNNDLLNGEERTDKLKPLENDQKKVEKLSNNVSEKPLLNSNLKNEKNTEKTAEKIKVSTQILRLKRGAGSGVGVILAGGVDCEAKDVTVHRVLADSVASKAGLKRGVKVCSINGCAMAGLTHAQSVAKLKEQRSEVIIEIEIAVPENSRQTICGSEKAESKALNKTMGGDKSENDKAAGMVVTVLLEKAGGGAGLGFGLDGGRDSPRGDCSLTIKKLFAGGAAAQCGRILVGAELLSAGGQSMEGFTRTQAWAALKALPSGPVALILRNPKTV